MKWILVGLLTGSFLLYEVAADQFCLIPENYTTTETQAYKRSRIGTQEYFCIEKLFCQRTILEYDTRYRQVEVTKTRGVQRCCPGWMGDNCDIACAPGTYGQDCSRTCLCQNGAVCHTQDGTCVCPAGYRGSLCDEKCDAGTHGYYCQSSCEVCPADQCHHVTGCILPDTQSPAADDGVVETLWDNSLQIGVKEPEMDVSAETSESKRNSNGGGEGINLKLVVPVCLLVLIAILVVVIVFTKRRITLINKHAYSSSDVRVTYSAASQQEATPGDTVEADNELNMQRQISGVEQYRGSISAVGAACASSLCEDGPQAKHVCKTEDCTDLPAEMMSYRARMNNLNQGTAQHDDLDVEEKKINNTSTDGLVQIHFSRENTSRHRRAQLSVDCGDDRRAQLSVDCGDDRRAQLSVDRVSIVSSDDENC